jgi:hypothetical protein
MHLEKHGLGQQRDRGSNRRIEAFKMPDLSDPLVRSRESNQFLSLVERGGERLFDEHIHSRRHQLACDCQVMHGGSRDRSGLQFAVRGQHLLDGTESLTSKLARYTVSAVHVGIDHTQQANWLRLLFEFLVHSGMIASKDAHAHHGDGDRTLRWQEKFSMAGCRKEIVNGNQGKSICISAGGSGRVGAAFRKINRRKD